MAKLNGLPEFWGAIGAGLLTPPTRGAGTLDFQGASAVDRVVRSGDRTTTRPKILQTRLGGVHRRRRSIRRGVLSLGER